MCAYGVVYLFEFQIITVELNRGWNSRLGFSLQTNPNTKQTVISAIYSNSVAAKDGRLRVGDQILMVSIVQTVHAVPCTHTKLHDSTDNVHYVME